MSTGVSNDKTAVQRNSAAVRKIFTEHHHQAKVFPESLSTSQKTNSASLGVPVFLHSKYSAEAFTKNVLGGDQQPEWRRTCGLGKKALADPFCVAADLPPRTAVAGEFSSPGECRETLRGEDLVGRATCGGRLSSTSGLLHYRDSNDGEKGKDHLKSNLVMTMSKKQHQLFIPSTKASGSVFDSIQDDSALQNTAKQRRARREAFHRQQSIVRYEMTLPLRRAADPYVNLTAAQLSTHRCVPTLSTLKQMSERLKGRHPIGGSKFHQVELCGEPLVGQLLRGDFYEGPTPAALRSASQHCNGQPRTCPQAKQKLNFIQKNKFYVRELSAMNCSSH